MEKCDIYTKDDKKPGAVGLFLTILIIVFVVEIFTNAVANLFRLPTFQESLVDAILTILVSYPVLYIFIFRPLSAEIICRRKSLDTIVLNVIIY